VSNAYRLTMPPAAEKMLGQQYQAVPLPDDHEQRQADREQDWQRMFSGLPGGEKPGAVVQNEPLAKQLGTLWAAMRRNYSAT
jgi:hypothetical protein